MQDLISVIVPIYNVEEYIEKCIKSIITQTYSNLEIILVDDGSTDNSGEICEYYKKIDSRIIVIHQNNKGVVSARSIGIEKSTGKYIGFVDGDDYIDASMYEKMYLNIINTNADMIHMGYFQDEYKDILGVNSTLDVDFQITSKCDFICDLICNNEAETWMSPSIWSKLFNRDIIIKSNKNVSKDMSYGEDLMCLLNVIQNSSKIRIINDAAYHYVTRKDSVVNKINESIVEREEQLHTNILQFLNKNNYNKKIKKYIDNDYNKRLLKALSRINAKAISCYEIADIQRIRNKKIILYGAGIVGLDYYKQICLYRDCIIVCWVDRDYTKYNFDFCEVKSIFDIKNYEYDVVLLALSSRKMAEKVREDLVNFGVEYDKIIIDNPRDTFEIGELE